MNTTSPENLHTSRDQERTKEESSSNTVESPQTLRDLFSQVNEIQSARNTDEGKSTRIDETVNRLNIDVPQVEIAKSEIGFAEKSENIAEKWEQARKRLEMSVQKALLPVVTALSLHTLPGLAQEAPREPLLDSASTTLIEKSTSHELTMEDVFDMNSPLALASKKIELSREEQSPENLSFIKDFSHKVWFEENEWMSISGKDTLGKPMREVQEMGPTGGMIEFDQGMVSEGVSTMHTHPVEAIGVMGYSPGAIRNGTKQAFVMPPSATDIGSCIDNPEKVHQIVDPRGVWRYQCDADHMFASMKKDADSKFKLLFQSITTRFSVTSEDRKQALVNVKDAHPSNMMQKYFAELEKKYPGIEAQGRTMITDLVASNQDIAMNMMNYEKLGAYLTGSSLAISDTKLSEEIKEFIRQAETLGVYISYTPFKERPTREEKEQGTE